MCKYVFKSNTQRINAKENINKNAFQRSFPFYFLSNLTHKNDILLYFARLRWYMKTVWEFFPVMKEYFFFFVVWNVLFFISFRVFSDACNISSFCRWVVSHIYILFENVANVEERFTMHKFLLPHILYLIIQWISF